MQNTTIICKIKFDFIYWSNMTKNRNNAFHIDTFTSGDKISPIGSSHDKTVYMPCSIKSLTKRMDSVFRPKIFVSSVFVISFFSFHRRPNDLYLKHIYENWPKQFFIVEAFYSFSSFGGILDFAHMHTHLHQPKAIHVQHIYYEIRSPQTEYFFLMTICTPEL